MGPPIKGIVILDHDGRAMSLDRVTGSIPIIKAPHGEVHKGNRFTMRTDEALLADGGQIRQVLSVPSGYNAHLKYSGMGESHIDIALYENTSYSAPGSQQNAPVNHNRQTKPATVVTAINSFTVQASGDLLAKTHSPADIRGGYPEWEDEWVLAEDTVYMIILESQASSNDCILDIDWYEEETP